MKTTPTDFLIKKQSKNKIKMQAEDKKNLYLSSFFKEKFSQTVYMKKIL